LKMTKLNWMRSTAFGLTLAAVSALVLSEPAEAGIFISVRFGPPALPVYVQPVCPAAGYIWTPGYWAYSDLSGYYWVPGTWVLAPQPGYLWTPPYWGFAGGVYGFHPGYWGPRVGFYGGVNYGYGYGGYGFDGGVWEGGVFRYNQVYSNVNVAVIHNVYSRTVVYNNVSHVSYNGGPGGINVRASQQELLAERDHHMEATANQLQHERTAVANRQQWATENHGRPAFAASARPGEFNHGSPVARPAANQGSPAARPLAQSPAQVHNQAAQPQVHNQAPVHTPAQPQAQQHLQNQGHPQQQGQARPQGQPQGQPQGHPQGQPHGEGKPQSGKGESGRGEHGKQ
jgi:hypothetical protein